MSGRYSDQDVEHYDRPRRRTRPRTKERPTYDDAEDGVVVTVDRGRFTLLVGDRPVTAMKARPLGRKGVVVGDRVRVVGDTSGRDGSLVIYGGSAGPGLLSCLGDSVDGLFLGRFAHDPAALADVLDEAAALADRREEAIA